jgi:hypothetical protein
LALGKGVALRAIARRRPPLLPLYYWWCSQAVAPLSAAAGCRSHSRRRGWGRVLGRWAGEDGGGDSPPGSRRGSRAACRPPARAGRGGCARLKAGRQEAFTGRQGARVGGRGVCEDGETGEGRNEGWGGATSAHRAESGVVAPHRDMGCGCQAFISQGRRALSFARTSGSHRKTLRRTMDDWAEPGKCVRPPALHSRASPA